MSRLFLALALVLLAVSGAIGQTLELDRIGAQQHRDYLHLLPFEQIDTQGSNLIITLTDLVLPGNAGHNLSFQLTYNSNSDVSPSRFPNFPWRFGIPGVPMRIFQEQAYPTPGTTVSNTLDDTRDVTPILEMADGAHRRTVFVQNPITNEVLTSEFWRYHHDTHTLELADGTVFTYDPVTFRLIRIADVFGNLVTLTWSSGALVVQQLLNGEQPRTVSFAMNEATGLPTTLTFNDGSHDRVWQYAYEGGAGDTTGRLTRTTPPLGAGWTFEYGDFSGLRRLVHLTTPHGGRIDYGYEVRNIVLDGQPEFTRALLSSRDVFDRNAGSSSGHWSIRCEWFPGDTFCHHTTVQTPSARLTYYYGPLGVAHPNTIIEGPYGLTRVTVQDPAGTTTFDDAAFTYIELPVVGSYRSAELLSRSVTRAGRTYTTTYSYDTGDGTAQYHCPTGTREEGELTRTVQRTYTHYRDQPFISCLMLMERVTVGSESLQRDFQYDASSATDRKGFVTFATEAGGLPLRYVRDAGGNVASFTRRGMTTTYSYSGGRQTQVANPLTTINRTFNADGTLASETYGGRTATYQYDDLSRIVSSNPPGGTNSIITEYDNANGAWIRQTRGTAVLTTEVDGFGRPTLTSNSVGVKTTTDYDGEGRVIAQGYPFTGSAGPRTVIEYDAVGRVTRRVNPDGTFSSLTYGPGTVTAVDENGHQTVQTWQAFGHPDDVRMAYLLDADQKLWSYSYHVLGELSTVVAPDGRTRSWLYTDQHLLRSETHPESGTTTYGYDWVGRLVQRTDANGLTTAYTYDANNRVETITAGSRITKIGHEVGSDNRQWTSSGRTDSPNHSVGSVDNLFAFDDAGRMVGRTTSIDGKVFTTEFHYDGNDTLTSVAYPTIGGIANRRIVGYDVDVEHRITRVVDRVSNRVYASSFTYHPSGGVASFSAGNGVATVTAYNPTRYWVASVHSGALQLEYNGYDNVGNVTAIADSRAGMSQTFGYDALDRLTSVEGPFSSRYAYDVHGSRRDPNNSAAYQYDPSTLRLVAQYGVPFTYDANGNLKTAPGRLYTYTPENWLETAVADGVVNGYEYDADGWRLKKVTPGGVTYYLRGLNNELLTEWTNPGPSGSIRDYIYAGQRLLSAVTSTLPLDSGDVVATLSIGGPPVPVTIQSANQNGRALFNASAGQTVDVQVASPSAFDCRWTLSLIAPNGTVLTSMTPCSGTVANTGPRVLTATGTYLVLVDSAGVTGTMSVAVTDQGGTAPVIASLSPSIVLPGSEATITGTRLTPVSAVRLNGYAAVVAASSSTAVTFTVPRVAASGRVSIVTPSGQAISSGDLFVPPPPYTVSDVAVTTRLSVGSSSTVTIPNPKQIALLVFDRAAGQRFSFTISNQSIDLLHLEVLRPDGVALYSSGAVYPFAPYFTDAHIAPLTGTYTLVIKPYESSTGSATVTLTDVPFDVTGQIVAGGAPVTLTITTTGQNGRVTFVGNAGQRIALTTTATTIPYTGVTIQAPDGSQVAYGPMVNNNYLGPVYLPVTGFYNIFVNPFETYTGAMTLTLYDVEPDVSRTLPTDGTPITVNQTIFQTASLTFTAAAGQHFTGTLTAGTTNGCGRFGYVFDPNGRSMYGVFCADDHTFPDTLLNVSGTYTIRLDPNWLATGTYTARVMLSMVSLTSVAPMSAPVGATVTITGVGFGTSQGTSSVQFNGTPATVLTWSSTNVTATVPNGATSGPVVVTVNGQASNGLSFTVLQPPSVTSVNPTSGMAGQSVTITGSNFGATQGNSTVSFNGIATSITNWGPTSVVATVPGGATTGPLVVTVNGIVSNATTFVVVKQVTYHLHKEASDINRLFRLRVEPPDSATSAQSANTGNATGEIVIKAFVTDSGVPAATGSLPGGTPVTAVVYMRKTTTNGVIYPRVRARLNSDTGPLLCQATSTTALTSITTRYVLSCTTGAVTIASTDRIYLWVGANITAAGGGNTKAELSIEGTNGSTDSLLTVQLPR